MNRILSFVFCLVLIAGVECFAKGKTVDLKISTKGDQLVYDKDSLSAGAGDTVKLTFTNKASKGSGLTHNWVLVKPGTNDAVANAGMSAGADKGWIAETPDVIAHTKLIDPGKSDSVTFTAPDKGDYPYFCTFPGHATMMKGTLHVK